MESTPPSHRSNPKSASRLAKIPQSDREPLNLSLDLVLPSSKNNDTPYPSPASARSSCSPVPLRELLLLSPLVRRSRTRLADKLEMAADDAPEPPMAGRKRGKTKGGQKTLSACASPRPRRSKRRSEVVETREEKEHNVFMEETLKPRRRRTNGRSKKEKQSSIPPLPVPGSSSNPDEDICQGDLNRIGEIINDLVMWRDAAKSTLWFGFGCLCFLSSCFTTGVNFSVFSAVSHMGLLLLGASFLSNTLSQRNNEQSRREFHVREQDIVRIAKRVLPATNFAISKMRELFSGEPLMTLKVTPILLIGAEYGYFITLWRLCALGFFLSFTVPKLYSSYASDIHQKAGRMQRTIEEAWGGCSHKKMLAFSAITAFWNLTSAKTRFFAVFVLLVILRYKRQSLYHTNTTEVEDEEAEAVETQPQLQPQEEQLSQPESQSQSQSQEEQPFELQQEQLALVVVAETQVSKKKLS